MGDPLSAAASILAVLQLSSSVIGYLRNAQGASKECKKLVIEISFVKGMLDTLKDIANEVDDAEHWTATFNALLLPDGPVTQLEQVLDNLNKKLIATASTKGLKKIVKSLLWPLRKDETEKLLLAVERQKTLLALLLENNHLALSQAIKTLLHC